METCEERSLSPLKHEKAIDEALSSGVKNNNSSCFRSWTFLIAIFFCRISQGMFVAILSPTLLFIADNVNQSVAAVSPTFTGMNFGYLIGSFCAGFVLKFRQPLLIVALCVFCSGLFLVAVPFVKSIVLLISIVSLSGFAIGISDTGTQGLILKVWGVKKSRMHLQCFHFAFTVGGVCAPIIAKPFLEMASLSHKEDTKCPESNVSAEVEMGHLNVSETRKPFPADEEVFNPVVFAFIICSTFTVLSSIFMLVLACKQLPQRIMKQRIGKSCDVESRDEKPLKEVLPLFCLFSLFMFSLAGADHPLFNYTFALAVCSHLHFSESKASILTSIFWCGYGSGRLLAVPISRRVKPQKIITVCVTGCLFTLVTYSIFGESTPLVTWSATYLYSFFSAPLGPASVSWMSRFFNISGKYVFITNCGTAIGSMVMVTVSGIIFQQRTFAVVFSATGMIGLACMTFVAMALCGRKQLVKENLNSKDLSTISANNSLI